MYGPVCPVVWEGEGRETFPYPDFSSCLTKSPWFFRAVNDHQIFSNNFIRFLGCYSFLVYANVLGNCGQILTLPKTGQRILFHFSFLRY